MVVRSQTARGPFRRYPPDPRHLHVSSRADRPLGGHDLPVSVVADRPGLCRIGLAAGKHRAWSSDGFRPPSDRRHPYAPDSLEPFIDRILPASRGGSPLGSSSTSPTPSLTSPHTLYSSSTNPD